MGEIFLDVTNSGIWKKKEAILIKLKPFSQNPVMEEILRDVLILGIWRRVEATLRQLRSLTQKPAMGEIFLDVIILGCWSVKEAILIKLQSFLIRACDGGNLLGCNNLGWIEQERGNLEEAASLFGRVLRWRKLHIWM